jgi:hypothetical protein
MRHATLTLVLMLSLGSLAVAQDAPDPASTPLTHGELSVLLLKVGQPGGQVPGAEVALKTVQDMGLVPSDRKNADVVTHGQFSDIVSRFGVEYAPADRDEVMSVAFGEAFIRREFSRLRDYMTKTSTHSTMEDVLVEEAGRAVVSPSDF